MSYSGRVHQCGERREEAPPTTLVEKYEGEERELKTMGVSFAYFLFVCLLCIAFLGFQSICNFSHILLMFSKEWNDCIL